MLPRWLIKLGFHLLYNQLAWTYELVAWLVSFGQWSTWRQLALQFMNPGPTLELAFGTGVFFIEMIRAGYEPVGIDLSPYRARQAGRRLHQNNCAIRLSQAETQAIPFPANHFVNVVGTFPTDFMLDKHTLTELFRVLKDDANSRLIIVAEGQLRGPWPIRPFIDWLYKISNQRTIPPQKPIKLLAAHNFEARWEIVEYQGAQARLLIAGKRADAD